MNSQKVQMLRSINQIESTIHPPVNSLSMFIAALTAMGSGETIRRALERISERASEREIGSATELVRALYDIGEGVSALKISRLIAELKEGKTVDATYGLYALVDLLPHDAYMAFGFAVESAQIRCGEHPNPQELLADIDFDREGFRFGSAWQFWGNRSPEAIRTAREAFIAALLHAAGLSDEPDYPEPLAD